MAGAGAKLFTSGSVLTAAQVNTFLMDQAVMVFATTTARDAAFGGVGEPTLAEGMYAFTSDTNTLWFYTGSAWESAGATTQGLTLNAQTGTTYTLAACLIQGSLLRNQTPPLSRQRSHQTHP
jgi:hypothetical protein